MKIHIMKYRQAIQFVPNRPTLVMRIFGSDLIRNHKPVPLQDSSFFTVYTYVFDDQDPDELIQLYPSYDLAHIGKKYTLFDSEIAAQILTDFENANDGSIDLLVHCTLGANRSPAVAIALNEIYDLGHDSEKLKQKHKAYNRFVYRVMLETYTTRNS